MSATVVFLAAFVSSALTAVFIVMTQHLHGHLSLDDQTGVQKLHKQPTPRIGGVALLTGAVLGGICLPLHTQGLWWTICLAAIPAFVSGLVEDVTKRVGVRTRLLATICAGLIFCLLSGYRITAVDIPGIDSLLSVTLFSLAFTAFAIGGIANAINIIDGVNGLASGTSIIILAGFAVVAAQTGDVQILAICLVYAGALGGFFLLNFPMGRIFLGDAGAYTTGFVLAAVAVALPQRNAELSPLIGLLALAYPVTETMVSIHRRLVREGTHPGQPDRLHLHSLIYRSRARRLAQSVGAPQLRNAMTGLMVMVLPLVSAGLMVMVGGESGWCLICSVIVAMAYLAIYRKSALLGPASRLAVYHPKVSGLRVRRS